MNKDVKTLLKQIEQVPGVTTKTNGRGHTGIYLNGQYVASLGGSPSDSRWRENILADLKRGGVDLSASAWKVKPASTESQATLSEIRDWLLKLKQPRAQFARFVFEDMRLLRPELQNFTSHDSAQQALYKIVKGHADVSEWIQQLLSAAISQWESIERQKQAAPQVAEPQVAEPQVAEPETQSDSELAEMIEILDDALLKLVKRVGQLEERLTKQEQTRRESHPAVGPRETYGAALLKILESEGSLVDEKILDRLDKLVGV